MDIDNVAFVLVLAFLFVGILICIYSMVVDLLAWLAGNGIGIGMIGFALVVGALSAVGLLWFTKGAEK